MSKKQKKIEAEISATESEKEDQISEGVIQTATEKTAKEQEKELKKREKEEKRAEKQKAKDAKASKDGKKKPKNKEKKGGLIKKSKETVSELKKVTWPTFGDVVKKTCVVVAFVLIAGVFLFALNYVLGGLINLLIKGTWV